MPVLLAATSATKEPADGFLVKDIISILVHVGACARRVRVRAYMFEFMVCVCVCVSVCVYV